MSAEIMRESTPIAKANQTRFLKVFLVWALFVTGVALSAMSQAKELQIPSQVPNQQFDVKLLWTILLPADRDDIIVDLDSATGDLYIAGRVSGRIRHANWKTKELGDWATLDSTGCKPHELHISQMSPMRSRPYVVAKNCVGVTILDKATFVPVRTINAPDAFETYSFDLSSNEDQVIVISRKSRDVWTTRLYETSSWNFLREWPLNNAQFLPDGKRLATGVYLRSNPSLKDDDRCGVAFYDVKTGERTSQWSKQMPGTCPQYRFSFPNGRPGRMVTDDYSQSAISEWDIANGTLLQHLPSNIGPGGPPPVAECISLSYDGTLAAVVRARFEWYAEYGLTVWNLESGKALYELPLGPKTDPVQCIQFSSNGKNIAFVHSDRVEVFEYDFQTGSH
jgi:WD40 repeat protein